MKTLVIAEKPSVAQDIVRALTPESGKFDKFDDHFENERFVVTSAVGHLLEIQAPESHEVKRGKWSFAHLPVIPPHFDVKPVDKTKSRLAAVVKQAKRKDVGSLINACDAGREGELIFRLIAQYAFEGKPSKPVERLWLQSMTPQAIRDGFAKLRSDAEMQGLADAARSRSEADWLVGINGTRAMTAFNSQGGGFFLTTVGRVQTPTLAIVVEREEQIRRHIARDYFEIHADFAAQAGSYAGKWFDPAWKKDAADADKKADRLWDAAQAEAIVAACRGQKAVVKEETKPTSQSSPLLFDLTSLQREANGKFGFSAKTTLSLAQSLYERHKALTYPRTDSRYLPEDYLGTVKGTFAALADSGLRHLAPHAKTALDQGMVRPSKRIFDDSKVSDHFAIIPTPQPPTGLSEAEQKIYDLVTRRFMAVFFPAAQYAVTTRISTVAAEHHFKTEGKVLTEAGWLAIYGKEAASEISDKEGKDGADSKNQTLPAVAAGEQPPVAQIQQKALKTRPPARYNEATLLGAMEGAGKLIDDEELREAMQEKGLGTPATRAAIIEGLLAEKYLLRDGRDIIPMPKAFQLMTLLRGLEVKELTQPQLTGQWEYKLAQMERGQLSRSAFMQEIAAMTERMVKKAKEYDRDTIPGDYATLGHACPNCGGQVQENYRRFACVGKAGSEGCGFSMPKTPGGRTLAPSEADELLAAKRIGPLEGFRSKAGWPFVAELQLVRDEEANNYKMEFDFGNKEEDTGELQDFSAQSSLGTCPACGGGVFENATHFVCEKAVPTAAQPTPSCKFKSGKIILQQPVEREQMQKLLATGKTDELDKFVSTRTRRPFKAMLAWSAEEGKVVFEFAPRADGKVFARRGAAKTATAKKVAAKKTAAKKVAAKKAPAEKKAKAAPRAGNLQPSAALAAVIGEGQYGRGEATKKLWDYIKANNLQDAADKRTINADAKLQAVFDGQAQVNMFKLAGILAKHLS